MDMQFLCFPPCQDTNSRCSTALLPRSVQARPYDRALCISVTIASRAQPYTFTLRKNVILSRHLMLWTNNQIMVPAYPCSFSSNSFTGTVAACAGNQQSRRPLAAGSAPSPGLRDGIPACTDCVFPRFLGVSLSQVLPCPLQCNFAVHF